MMIAAPSVEPPDVTHNIWLVVGVPVLVALIGAAAAVTVAWRASRASIENGDRDRQLSLEMASAARSDRQRIERAETYEVIVEQIADLAGRYVDLVRAETAKGTSPDLRIDHPHRAGLVRALARITSRHDDEDINLALVEWLHVATEHIAVSEGAEMLGMFQSRVAAWYLEKGSGGGLQAYLDDEIRALNDGAGLNGIDTDV